MIVLSHLALHSPKLLYYYNLSKPFQIYAHELDSLNTPLGPEHYTYPLYSLPFPLQPVCKLREVSENMRKTYISLYCNPKGFWGELHVQSWKHIFMSSFSVLPTQSTLKRLSEMPLGLKQIKVAPLITHFFSGKGHPARTTYCHNYWHCVETSFCHCQCVCLRFLTIDTFSAF